MPSWTPEAEQLLQNYLGRVSTLSRANGDDAQEIVEGLLLHIRAEAEAKSGAVVTPDHVQRALAALGTPEQVAGEIEPREIPHRNGNGKSHAHECEALAKPFYSKRARAFVNLCGILIPGLSLGFEFYFGAMAELYADPIPTLWHVAAGIFLLVSLSLTDRFLAAEQDGRPARWHNWIFFLNAYAIALSTIYFAVYIPILPIAVFALLAYGLGTMGFAPMFCLIASLLQARALYRMRAQKGDEWSMAKRYSVAGALLVALLAGVYVGPQLIASRILPMALDEDPATRANAVALIRNLHLDGQLLNACYEPIVRGIGPSRRWTQEAIDERTAYRDLYFRVTGVPYNSVPKPDQRITFRTRPFAQDWEEERAADSEVGGTSVAGRVKGLNLHASSLDVNIMRLADNEAAPQLAYMEWIIEFSNQSDRQREARMQIELPHGGVASRLSLWIDGKEREAAFGGRAQVRAAYQSVAVVQRRDPALLNVAGPDKALLQCFPINARSTMKVKIGITAPMIERDGKAYLRLPYISERNFTIPPEFTHAVWVEGDPGIVATSPLLKAEPGSYGRTSLRAAIAEADMQRGNMATVSTDAKWAPDTAYTALLGEQRASMSLASPAGGAPSTVCFVLDGSAGMRDVTIDWNAVLKSLPVNTKVCAVFAGESLEVSGEQPEEPTGKFADWFGERTFQGGCDPMPALVRACDWIGRDGVIVWVHGPLPVELSSPEALRQWERRRSDAGVRILAVEAVPGPNRLLEQCGDMNMIDRVPVFGTLESTIAFAALHRAAQGLSPKFALDQTQGTEVVEPAAGHLVRLGVNSAVLDAVKRHDDQLIELLRPRAVQARLITPVSGAVVLETMQQYAQHGLDPTQNEEAIPGVPEPHEWALMIVVALMLIGVAGKRARDARMAAQA